MARHSFGILERYINWNFASEDGLMLQFIFLKSSFYGCRHSIDMVARNEPAMLGICMQPGAVSDLSSTSLCFRPAGSQYLRLMGLRDANLENNPFCF